MLRKRVNMLLSTVLQQQGVGCAVAVFGQLVVVPAAV